MNSLLRNASWISSSIAPLTICGGPLATIKGLVNLLKLRQDNNEVDELTALIDVHANKLDDRLFKLLYLANTNSVTEDCKGVLNFQVLKSRLDQLLQNNFQLEKAMFTFTFPNDNLKGRERKYRLSDDQQYFSVHH